MNPTQLFNAADRPLNQLTGSVPNVSGALRDYFQPMKFTKVGKQAVSYEAVETPTDYDFQGVIQPLSARLLLLKPEGQRSWTWLMLHSDINLKLETDDVVNYLAKQTRIMGLKDFSLYGYMYYELVQDWTGAGPS